jgi:hypothetical protein
MKDIMHYCYEEKNWTGRYWDEFWTIKTLNVVKDLYGVLAWVEEMNKMPEEYPSRVVGVMSTV